MIRIHVGTEVMSTTGVLAQLSDGSMLKIAHTHTDCSTANRFKGSCKKKKKKKKRYFRGHKTKRKHPLLSKKKKSSRNYSWLMTQLPFQHIVLQRRMSDHSAIAFLLHFRAYICSGFTQEVPRGIHFIYPPDLPDSCQSM